MDKEKRFSQITKWTTIYSSVYCCLTVAAVLFEPPKILLVLTVAGVICFLCSVLLLPYKRNYLFAGGLISTFSMLQIGVFLGGYLQLETIISIGAAVSVVDVLSFTRLGKRTVNAKIMAKPSLAARLILYGKGPGDKLVPTCGMGDWFLYALWISGTGLIFKEPMAYLFSAAAILLGTLIDNAVIKKWSKKENFKGFPATIIPFTCIVGAYILTYFIF